jgi:large subunit ribosomal protein L18
MALTKQERRNRIKMRIRKRITGTLERPRLSVYRSNKQISVQIIDDVKGTTLVAASSLNKEVYEVNGINKTQKAELVGKLIAERAAKAGINSVTFDRNGYLYHGRIKKLAEAAREGGLKF